MVLRSEETGSLAWQDRVFRSLGRKGGIRVLGVLLAHPDREFTVRELAEEAGVPAMTGSRILRDFHQLRVVRRRKVGPAYAVSLDEENRATRFLRRIWKAARSG